MTVFLCAVNEFLSHATTFWGSTINESKRATINWAIALIILVIKLSTIAPVFWARHGLFRTHFPRSSQSKHKMTFPAEKMIFSLSEFLELEKILRFRNRLIDWWCGWYLKSVTFLFTLFFGSFFQCYFGSYLLSSYFFVRGYYQEQLYVSCTRMHFWLSDVNSALRFDFLRIL